MKKRSLGFATGALAPLVAILGATAAADEMEVREMRVWSAVLSEPGEEAAGAVLKITASASTTGSNGMIVESVAVVSTETDDQGNMTETMSSVACKGPFMLQGRRSFMVEAPSVDEDAEKKEAEAEPCAFAVSGEVRHTYRSWHSWDMSGSVTMGETPVEFSIADPAPAMLLEPEPEEEMSEEGKASS